MRLSLIALAAFFLAAPAFAEAPTVKPADDFTGIGFKLTSSGTVKVYAAPRQIGDKLAICGLVLVEKSTNTTKAIEPRFTSGIVFRLGGQRVGVETAFFKRYYDEAALQTAVAGCSVTQTPWDKAFSKAELKLEMAPRTIAN